MAAACAFANCTLMYHAGVLVGVAAGCLSLSLPIVAASVVITLLCTRRSYSKKNTSPEKSVYYRSDSVQMQPCPAYETVEPVK